MEANPALSLWAGGTAATAGDCKSPTLETSKVRVLPGPFYADVAESG